MALCKIQALGFAVGVCSLVGCASPNGATSELDEREVRIHGIEQGLTQSGDDASHHGGHETCSDDDERVSGPAMRSRAEHRVSWRSRRHRPEQLVTIKVLGLNDFHGQLSEGRLVGGRPVGGAAVLASYLAEERIGFEDSHLIVHAGDHVGASPPASALLQDEPSITFLNLLGNEHCSKRGDRSQSRCNLVGTLGNHEFDEGTDELLRMIHGGNHPLGPFLEDPYRGADFAYVSANVIDTASNDSLLPRYVVRKIGGVRVGVVGAVLRETVGSSRVDLQACKLEYSIVSPK